MEPIQQYVKGTTLGHVRKTSTVLVAGAGLAWLVRVLHDRDLAVEEVKGCYDAIAAVADDPAGYALVVHLCDDTEGLEQGQKVASLLRSIAPRVPVILMIAEGSPWLQGEEDRRSDVIIHCRQATHQIVELVLARASHGHATWMENAG